MLSTRWATRPCGRTSSTARTAPPNSPSPSSSESQNGRGPKQRRHDVGFVLFRLLDDLYPAVTPKHEAGNPTAFTNEVQAAAEHPLGGGGRQAERSIRRDVQPGEGSPRQDSRERLLRPSTGEYSTRFRTRQLWRS
jgi:hypothetical protein